MKLFILYNKGTNKTGFVFDQNYVLVNDSQWISREATVDFLPQLLNYVSEEQLPHILTKLGNEKQTDTVLQYTNDEFIFNETNFNLFLESNTIALNYQIDEYKEYLSDTDWYVTRFLEINETIPQEISDNRANARNQIDILRSKII